MRLTELEYQALLSKRADGMKEISFQLGIPAPRNARKLADDSIPLSSKPLNIKLVSLPPQVKQKALESEYGTKSRKPNKTELEYSRMLACEFPGAEIVFEGLKIKLNNGHVYSPDWIVKPIAGGIICCEVKARGKNGFRQASYGRAKLAFDQARIDYCMFTWRWAEKCGGIWNEKRY